MSTRRFLAIAAAALLALLAALYAGRLRHGEAVVARDALLPDLKEQLNAVDGVTIRKGAAAPLVSLHKQGAVWTVAERGGYPADAARLRKLLLDLAKATVVEEKSANPANYPLLGVDDPAQPGAAGAEITLEAAGRRRALIVGKPSGAGNFVRRAGEAQSLLVEPAIAVDTQPRDWIDSRVADIPPASIQRIEVKPAAGPSYGLHRAAPGGGEFALDAVPKGRTAADAGLLAPAAGAFGEIVAEDVAQAGDIDLTKASTATVTLADGTTVTLTGAAVGEKHWLLLRFSKDGPQADKTRGRAFEIPKFRYDSIFRPLDLLLKPKS